MTPVASPTHARLDHITFLVCSLDRAIEVLEELGLQAEEPQEFEEEGTRESYVGPEGVDGRLLLMEPVCDGPYAEPASAT